MSDQPFVPMPLCRTPTLSHEPVPAPVYQDLTLEEALAAEDKALAAQKALAAEDKARALRRQEALKSIFARVRKLPAMLPRSPSVSPVHEPSALVHATTDEPLEHITASTSSQGLRADYDSVPRGPAPLVRSPCALPELK